ncbi:MAG: hypothetical protein PHW10_04835 [Candidatus Peribacteraceae bacterium]|nr:hypothetical protein [Candidatus Peribacteraceae bacterium]
MSLHTLSDTPAQPDTPSAAPAPHGAFAGRVDAIKEGLRKGIPLHEMEEILDAQDAASRE